ncbi:MAG: glycosyltransferase family 39 protein [Proteobacteria bacterium]|nr:glycosyltransferase family 39 protein [Pseudomonadota bacterium]
MSARLELRVAIALFGALLAVFATLSLLGGPLGHDESAYALGGRGMLHGGETTGFGTYRSYGTAVLATIPIAFGAGDLAFRIFGSSIALLTMFVYWRAGRRIVRPGAALLAVAAIGTSWIFLRRGHEMLSDVPSSALLFLLVFVMAREVTREGGISTRFLLVAPLAAGAFYVRYGSVLTSPVIFVTAAALWPRELWRAKRIVAATCAMLTVLLIPHLALAIHWFDNPLGILLRSREAEAPGGPGGALLDYAVTLPRLGVVVGVLMMIGIARPCNDRVLRFIWIVSLGQLAVLCLRGHGELRYLFFAIFLLTMLGAHVVCEWLAKILSHRGRWVMVAASTVFALNAAACVGLATDVVVRRAVSRQVLVDTAVFIGSDGTGSCAVLSRFTAQMTWYTGCWGSTFGDADDPMFLRHERRYIVFFEGLHDQPSGQARDKIVAGLKLAAHLSSQGRLGDASIYTRDRRDLDPR